ncbi:MAG TPA: hypothetical protein VGE76_02560 [Opitutaceae bacterium]
MGFFDRLFGRKRPADPAPTPPPLPAAPAPAKPAPLGKPAPEVMTDFFDAYGRPVQVTREQWRTTILPHNLREVWQQPEALAYLITKSRHDGFFAEVLPAAEHLPKIDPEPERAACLLGITYLKLERFAEAEKAFNDYIARHGETGSILTNLAKVYSAQKLPEPQVEATLWRGLTLDPYQDNGLLWFAVMHRERTGPAGETHALRRVATLPGSWRAQCWLAREALEGRALEVALMLYQEVLGRSPRPVPTDILQQISGDLGKHGHLPEALAFTSPHFQLEHHGLAVGNNLIKANLDLGRIDAARALVDRLYALKRPDWDQSLAYWDNEISRLRLSLATPAKESPPMALLALAGPVWLRPLSPAAELFLGKPTDAPVVVFYNASVEYAAPADMPNVQLSDNAGRLSRALPLFLAEQTYFRTDAVGRVLQAWIPSLHGAFAVTASAWSDADASAQARTQQPAADYAFTFHLRTTTTPWSLDLRLLRTIDGALLASTTIPLESQPPGGFLTRTADVMLSLLREHADLATLPAPESYVIPNPSDVSEYTLRLEQALAVAVAAMPEAQGGSLNREREIVSGMLDLCLAQPRNLPVRLLLVQTLTNLRKVRPQVVAEFNEKVTLLQREHPLPMPAQGVIQRMVDALFPDTP